MAYHLHLGIVGDDFTGSSDAASFAVKSGLKTMLFDGIPQETDLEKEGVQAVVIALKSRMAPVDEACSITLKAANWLKAHGAEHLYSKYCSTFDSTPKGNIGPILDNFLENFGEKASFICPALPVNGRIVRDGILFINGVPLAESPMKNHPLTPMWDSKLKNLMEAQSKYPCFEINLKLLYDEAELNKYIAELNLKYDHYYLIPDYTCDEDAVQIAKMFGFMQVQSGGSGILTALGEFYQCETGQKSSGTHTPPNGTSGDALIVAGSCSVATQGQIKKFIEHGHKAIKIDAHALMAGKLKAEELYAQSRKDGPCIIYSTAPAPEVAELQKTYGIEPLAAAIEGLMTELTKLAYQDGVTRYIVAGGETSGAVMRALPPDGYLIGESVAPGVPIMVPSQNQNIRLVLKSGNFGDENFFDNALNMTLKRIA